MSKMLASHVGQVEIEDDEIDWLRHDKGIHGLAAIERADNRVALQRREQVAQPALRDPVIVHDQNIVLRHHLGSSAPSPSCPHISHRAQPELIRGDFSLKIDTVRGASERKM
ncbi:hypothetical protein [Sphingopyxis sp. L1A2A]|uniref:hypothetical protein n=1 Tax=Sphingopyxis sp. L1A2A TaxID=2502247 RepID=UPI001485C35A|nr:hypothetical protein [Sphingopyxis sp. L1A2A]